MVGGHKYDDESFRECMLRELLEELGIANGDGFTVPDEPFHTSTYAAWSDSAAEMTDYTIALFDVPALESFGADSVVSQQPVRWLHESEIRAGVCEDGLVVSNSFAQLLDSVDWLVKK